MNQHEHPANSDQPPSLPIKLQQLEADLARFRPRADGLDRERLMYEAGRRARVTPAAASRITPPWLWPAATAGMTAVAACLAMVLVSGMLVAGSEPQVIERVKIVEVQRPVSEEVELPWKSSIEPAPSPAARRELAWHLPMSADAEARASSRSRVDLDFRLFEHLMAEPITPVSTSRASPPRETDEKVLSPRSLPRLLDQSASL